MSSVVIAGAGQRGLICAAQLAAAGADVVVVERLPHPGGQEPERSTARLAKAAVRAGARFVLGTLAVQYDGTVVDVLGVDGAGSLPCGALVVATGSRPATRAELGITGDRCAGVVPGSAALHLTQAGVLLGHRPLVAGSGAFAAHCAHVQLAAGASEVTMTLPARAAGEVKVPAGVRVFAGYRVASVHGTSRVEAAVLRRDSMPSEGEGEPPHPEGLSLSGDGEPQRIAADALILAAEMRPMRNIEGAITDREGVFFCQPEGEDRGEQSASTAAAATCSLVLAALAAGQSSVRSPGHDMRGS
jgi:pyruvate/2-oxoglutarate dehydrogenase complex dihydrolipoamide dehydrogenase (E3) component